MVDNGIHIDGTPTINWYETSIAPERLWEACYRYLVQDLRFRMHKARELSGIAAHRSEDYVDMAVDHSVYTSVASEVSI
jgi:hypothetical protein